MSTTSIRGGVDSGGHHVRSSSLLSAHVSSLLRGGAAETKEEEGAVDSFGTTDDQSSLPSSVFPHCDLEHENQKLTAAVAAAAAFIPATQQQQRDTTTDRPQQKNRTTTAIKAAADVRPALTIYNPSYYTYVASSSSYQHTDAAATTSNNVYRPTPRRDQQQQQQQQQQRILLPSDSYRSHNCQKKDVGGNGDEECDSQDEAATLPLSSWSSLVRYILSPRVLVTALVLGILVFNLLPSFGGAKRAATHQRPHSNSSRTSRYRRPRFILRRSSIQLASIGNSNGNGSD